MPRSSYLKLLRDQRWRARSKEVRRLRGNRCQGCGSGDRLQVHHGYYRQGLKPWDYDDATLWLLCSDCHHFMDIFRKAAVELIGLVGPEQAMTALKGLKAAAAKQGEI